MIPSASGKPPFAKLLVANRGEIAIRICRAATELGLATVAVYSTEDRFALHRFKADESYLIGKGKGPIEAYLSIDEMIRVGKEAGCDAVHPGYGFLSENPDFADAVRAAGMAFVGPSSDVMRLLGNKVAARALAEKAGVPVMPATGPLPADLVECKRQAAAVGYPLMLKASWGGGGRGMRVIEAETELEELLAVARREAKAAFGNDEVYLEKLVRRARHVEVQILGDSQGNLVHLYERDCSVQRRNQKVVERAPAPYLDGRQRSELCETAVRLARAAAYENAGTVEFLMDMETGAFYFIEVNPRVQVEHTVTEVVTGIDIVKAQIRIAGGAPIGAPGSDVPKQAEIPLNGHAIQCRITTEDPANNFIPDYGRISAYRGANGFGIRLDGGTAFSGALITRYYDSLLEKVTAWAPTPEEAIARMDRALREFRIRGVATNLTFLEAVIEHPKFVGCAYTTRFIDETPELFARQDRRDRATKVLSFVGDVMVNGNPDVAGLKRPAATHRPDLPAFPASEPPAGTRQLLDRLGAEGLAKWMLEQKRVLITDTTMRDAHQSLFATRMRSHDMLAAAPAYARLLPGLFSVECWGGATFDVAMRFLREDPWERLRAFRSAMPNLLLQMLLRSANAVGYTNYPDNVVRQFVAQAAENGVDVFRVFDSLNWVGNMHVAMDAVRESGKLCEAAICYTGDIFDSARPKYDLKYYVGLAKELEKGGAHILGIKDMAGLARPRAISALVSALKQETGLPIHFHTHDTSGLSAASVLAAVEAGVDAVDAAMDAMSGLTSQPPLGSICAALAGHERDPGLDQGALNGLSRYWEGVRSLYAPFEADIRSGTAEVYLHEMPGGQYTNLRAQARSLGVEQHWDWVAKAYADVNAMFGDVVKVTPTSKVVGDMALMMVTSNLTPADVLDPDKEIAFPESVVSFFKGDLGQPTGGFPAALQKKVLGVAKPITVRPGAVLPPADLDAVRAEAEKKAGRKLSDAELASYLMYPKVFADFAAHQRQYGDVSALPTDVFFWGMQPGQEIAIDLEKGKSLIVRYLATAEAEEDGSRKVFFELNGQPRTVRVFDRKVAPARAARPKAEAGNADHVGAPMPGLVVSVAVHAGQAVDKGDLLVSIEAMKMETAVRADRAGTVASVAVTPGVQVEAKDLLVIMAG
ncbi:pyruvate carboxylase [Paramagnetospirillum magneticum]|uniref:Pyruvate carboxylase n=1 Tax=Paramagnetospirillum magneticum (strain ATCC 700264 / AMB-1) TaxID=342108 RepID=Q2WAT2_PARM1|nr:pyruvate carboxylase [Paramagnetospirillum magneticum]BAE49043.1 Pyruvate carboxylase [Paramagnetospirillum magneticum AMB-1]